MTSQPLCLYLHWQMTTKGITEAQSPCKTATAWWIQNYNVIFREIVYQPKFPCQFLNFCARADKCIVKFIVYQSKFTCPFLNFCAQADKCIMKFIPCTLVLTWMKLCRGYCVSYAVTKQKETWFSFSISQVGGRFSYHFPQIYTCRHNT